MMASVRRALVRDLIRASVMGVLVRGGLMKGSAVEDLVGMLVWTSSDNSLP